MLSLSGSTWPEFYFTDCLHDIVAANEEPFVCLECVLSQVSPSKLVIVLVIWMSDGSGQAWV